MAIIISPAVIEDVPAISHVLVEAYSDDVFFPYLLLPTVPKEDQKKFWIGFISTGFQQSHNHFYKAVDKSTGEIVAFSWLIYPTTTKYSDEDGNSPLVNAPFMAEFSGALAAHQEKFVNPASTYFIYTLATLKRYRGRGVATQLMNPALVDADQANAQTYLDAFPGPGQSLYRKLGFTEVGATWIDMRKYGGREEHPIIAMIREPHAQEV